MPTRSRISLSIPDGAMQALKRLASEKGSTISSLIKEFIEFCLRIKALELRGAEILVKTSNGLIYSLKDFPSRSFAQDEITVLVNITIEGNIDGDSNSEINNLTNLISYISHVSLKSVSLLGAYSGSIILILEMPESAAINLLKLYLEKDATIASLEITRLELKPIHNPQDYRPAHITKDYVLPEQSSKYLLEELNEVDVIKSLIQKHKKRLYLLEDQQATYGLSTDPRITIEIDSIKTKITALQSNLHQLDTSP